MDRFALLITLLSAGAGEPAAPPAAFTYDQVVEPLPRPAWLERAFMFCMPYETPYQGSPPELKPWAARLKERGFVLLGMYPDSLCRLYRPASKEEEWSEACRAEVKRMHSLGLKVLAGVYPFVGSRGPRDLLTAHPEWRQRADASVPAAPGSECLVNPGFAAALRDLLVERAREYRIDGYQFDGWYQCAYCVCPGCRDLYREETGKAVPPRDPKDRENRRYVAWRDGKLLDNAKRLREALKAVNPEFA